MEHNTTLKKTIQIDPSFLKLTKRKTRKNGGDHGEVVQRQHVPKPIVSQQRIRNNLMKRVKEKTNQDYKSSLAVRQDALEHEDNDSSGNSVGFDDAIQYLGTLSTKSHNDENREKIAYEREKMRKTLKQPISSVLMPMVNVDLPDDFGQDAQPSLTPVTLHKYAVDKEIPYGCLKRGNKVTYKMWSQHANSMDRPVAPHHSIEHATLVQTPLTVEDNIHHTLSQLKFNEKTQPQQIQQDNPKKGGTTYMKRTIRRKYVVGKSPHKRTVSVLIKNRERMKKIVHAQKVLKQTEMTSVKKYLKAHGLIKAGSTAPQDVLRNMYETAILSGDVTNVNKETIIHNYLNSELD